MDNGITDAQFEGLFERAVERSFDDMINAVPSREELEKLYHFSHAHNTRIKKLFRKVEWGNKWKAAAIIACIFFGVLFAVSPDVRAAVRRTVIQWFDGYTKLLFSGQGETDFVPGSWRPQYLPEGFSESEVMVFGDIEMIFYTNSNGDEIILDMGPDAGTLSVNNDGVNYNQVLLDGIEYHVFEAFDEGVENRIVWYNDGCSFDLSSELPIEILQNIALSIIR